MHNYFCGWYFKFQSNTQTLAVIPAFHRSKEGLSASIQFITDHNAWNIPFSYHQFFQDKNKFQIALGNNHFSKDGIKLSLHTTDCSIEGSLLFGAFSPIRYDIMGPFQYIPFLQCRHSILSMKHSVTGNICINGVDYSFSNANGYLEGDRGYSFPKEYAWTQCFFEGGSLVLCVADIPFGLFSFTGMIGIIHYHGREYRLATYLGAKVIKIKNGELIIRQGSLTLSVKLLEQKQHPLLAPVSGDMKRTIHESACCRASYCFEQNHHTLFSFETTSASFEYEYPQ